MLDDGSLNGTLVNGERVRRRVLEHGDILTLGRRTLRFLEIRMRRPGLEQATEELEPSLTAAAAAAA